MTLDRWLQAVANEHEAKNVVIITHGEVSFCQHGRPGSDDSDSKHQA